jgi:N-acetylglutamate synthase-like GNAT family acetyltransferase
VGLNTRVGGLQAHADAYHLHDISLLASERGQGAGAEIVARLLAHARGAGFAVASLVSVNNSAAFWERAGFAPYAGDSPVLRDALASYGTEAVYMTCRL